MLSNLFNFNKRKARTVKGSTFKPIHISKLMEKELPKTEWLVEKLIPREGITIISGHPGSFKTWLIFYMAGKLSKGEKVFDKFHTSQCGVLFVDEENNQRTIQDRLKLLDVSKGVPIYFSSLKGYKINKQSIKQVIDFAKETNSELVVFDSLRRIHNGDENSAKEMSEVMDCLKELTRNGLTVVCIHHNRKNTENGVSLRGSSDILAAVDCNLSISKHNGLLKVQQTKIRQDEEVKPFSLDIVSSMDRLAFKFKGSEERVSQFERAKTLILNKLNETPSSINKDKLISTIFDTTIPKIGRSTVKDALNHLIAIDEVQTRKGQGNEVICYLEPEDKDNT